MSPADQAFLDTYPDPTWDEPEEQDDTHGMSEVSLEELMTPQLDEVPTSDSTEADVALMSPTYIGPGPETFIISGPISEEAKARKGPSWRGRVMTREAATAWVTATYGQILEEIEIPWRWAFRVYKPTSAKGRYTPPKEPS